MIQLSRFVTYMKRWRHDFRRDWGARCIQPTSSQNRGFALIELLIAVTLFGVVTAFVLLAYGKVSEQLYMTSLAYETALSFREAQSYGVSVKQFAGSFDYAYGLHFNTGVNARFVFFADVDGDTLYNVGDDDETGCLLSDGGECSSIYRLEKANRIKKFCGVLATDMWPEGDKQEECSVDSEPESNKTITFLDVSFLRPNPDAIIRTSLPDSSYKASRVYFISPTNIERIVEVWNTGQVSIK